MTTLSQAQRFFAAALEQPSGGEAAASFAALLSPGHRPIPEQGIAVYRNNSRGARLRAMEAVYPVCRQIVGNQCFRSLASDYMSSHPSNSGDLNRYGGELAAFLCRPGPTGGLLRELPYLADLAQLEWLWHDLHYAEDDVPFDLETFAMAAGREDAHLIRFRLAAPLRLLTSDYPVHEIWRRNREGDDTAEVRMGDGDRLVLVRERFRPRVVPVAASTHDLLTAIASGRTLGALEEEGIDTAPLPRLVQAGWISGFELTPSASETWHPHS
jgi:hypothetical protein